METSRLHVAFECELETLSPVHIGAGEQYEKGLDFVEDGQRVFIIDKERVMRQAATKGERGLNALMARIEEKDIGGWLDETGIPPGKVSRYSLEVARPHTSRPVNRIFRHIRNGTGDPLVPGSSLKGALRTCLLHSMNLRDGQRVLKAVIGELLKRCEDQNNQGYQRDQRDRRGQRGRRNRRGGGLNLKHADTGFINEFLGPDPNRNLMRVLMVSDFKYDASRLEESRAEESRPFVAETMVLSIDSNGALIPKQIVLFPEAIGIGAIFKGRVSFDEFLALHGRAIAGENAGFYAFEKGLSLAGLIDSASEMTRTLIEGELAFFKSHKRHGQMTESVIGFYEELREQHSRLSAHEMLLQMGWGTGWKATTGPLLGEDLLTPETRRCLKLAPHRLRQPFPKSRKVAYTRSGRILPLGWVRLRFIG